MLFKSVIFCEVGIPTLLQFLNNYSYYMYNETPKFIIFLSNLKIYGTSLNPNQDILILMQYHQNRPYCHSQHREFGHFYFEQFE